MKQCRKKMKKLEHNLKKVKTTTTKVDLIEKCFASFLKQKKKVIKGM